MSNRLKIKDKDAPKQEQARKNNRKNTRGRRTQYIAGSVIRVDAKGEPNPRGRSLRVTKSKCIKHLSNH